MPIVGCLFDFGTGKAYSIHSDYGARGISHPACRRDCTVSMFQLMTTTGVPRQISKADKYQRIFRVGKLAVVAVIPHPCVPFSQIY